ncbi:MAG: c-type cytochrome [Thioalkalivibrionaceae bacterium]
MKFLSIKSLAAVALIATPAFATTASAEDVTWAAVAGSSCFACHGAAGAGAGSVVGLAGYPEDLMVSQMKAFRDGQRPATVMNRHAKGYTDEEIAAISAWIAQNTAQN